MIIYIKFSIFLFIKYQPRNYAKGKNSEKLLCWKSNSEFQKKTLAIIFLIHWVML